MSHLSVVIPVYKAEGCLHELYRRLRISLETITSDFEVILVEDCGGDRSWEIICELAAMDGRVRGLQFSRNFGQHYGITAGLDHATGDWVVVMDCDLQDRPEEIPRLYAKAMEGYDVVLARRGSREGTFVRRIGSWFFYGMLNYFSEITYDSEVGNFRIISRAVVRNLGLMREHLRFFGGLVDWMGFPTASVDVRHDVRFDGNSSYTVRKLLKLASDAITSHSDKPLRLSIRFGFLMATLSFCYGFYICLTALFRGTAVLGWASIMVSMYFLGGIIIFILGIIGLYLGKTFEQVKGRPLYVVYKTTFSKSCE
ncbi:MAG: glycosyltransferase family 2 protein [Desulfuromonadales bacterium]|nr:glycosyltransferase family 2 protein [Desulfuromonadales bacterium]